MLIKELAELSGVSGDERRVCSFIREKVKESGLDSYTDSLGNLYAVKEGKGKYKEHELMLTAHMDEVGLMVASIEKSGHLRFYPVGGVDEKTLVSRPVRVGARDIPGVIGAKAVHIQEKEERTKSFQLKQLYIDIGAKNKEDAEKVVNTGDYVSFHTRAGDLGENIITGKALDNRAGCAALFALLQKESPYGFTGVFTVQEEVGVRGARVAAYRVNPKIAIVLETTPAADLPDVKEKDKSTVVGKGPALTLKDGSMVTHPAILERLIELAGEHSIPYQFRRFTGNMTEGGTISLSREGVMAGVISTPCRYLHAPISLLCTDDWKHLVDLTFAFIKSVQEKGL